MFASQHCLRVSSNGSFNLFFCTCRIKTLTYYSFQRKVFLGKRNVKNEQIRGLVTLKDETCALWPSCFLGCLLLHAFGANRFFFPQQSSEFILGFLVSFYLIQGSVALKGPVVWCSNTGRVGDPSNMAVEMAEDFVNCGFCWHSCQNRLHHCDLPFPIETAGNSGCPCPQGGKHYSRLCLRNLDKQVGCSGFTWEVSCQLCWLYEYRLGECGVL